MNQFEFANGVPSIDDIRRCLNDSSEQLIEIDGMLEAVAGDAAVAQRQTETKSILLRKNKACCRFSPVPRRGVKAVVYAASRRWWPELARQMDIRAYAKVLVSVDGKMLLMTGNDHRLLDLLCDASKRLGGEGSDR